MAELGTPVVPEEPLQPAAPRPEGSSAGPQGPPARQALQVEVHLASRSIWQVIGAILVTLALLWAAGQAWTLLMMLALSFFFSLAMEPAVQRLHARRGWRRGAAVGVIYAATIALLVFFVFVLIPAVKILADTVAASAGEWVANLNEMTTEAFGLPLDSEALTEGLAETGGAVSEWAAEPLGRVVDLASSTVSLLFNVATMALFIFYLSADAPRIKQAILRRFTPKAQERISWTWDQAIVQTGGYIYSRMILMAINGLGFFLTMVVVGMPLELAIPLALFAGFVSEFIPAVGTYIGAAVPIVLALAVLGVAQALVILGYALVYQQIENYWLSPKISSGTMTLNGGVAFGAAMAGGAIAGPMGAFVALPVAALITSMLSNYACSYELVAGPPDTAPPREPDPDGRGHPRG
jgi:predicted PurR-regulated permease PerM